MIEKLIVALTMGKQIKIKKKKSFGFNRKSFPFEGEVPFNFTAELRKVYPIS